MPSCVGLLVRTPAAALEPRLDLAEANAVGRGGRFHGDRELRCRAGCINREPAAPNTRPPPPLAREAATMPLDHNRGFVL